MTPAVWLLSGLSAWLSSFVFAAFGLFMGFLLPSENVMQFVGPLLAVLAMFGGLFIPLSALSPGLRTAAQFSPVWGVGQLARAPLMGGSSTAVASVVDMDAALRHRRDGAVPTRYGARLTRSNG